MSTRQKWIDFALFSLVILSVFLSYRLLFSGPRQPEVDLRIDTHDIISYAHFFATSPATESLGDLPHAEINRFFADALASSDHMRSSKETIDPFSERREGYLVEAGFDVPVRALFLSLRKTLPALPFSSYRKFFYHPQTGQVDVLTDRGMYSFHTTVRWTPGPFARSVVYDDEGHVQDFSNINLFSDVVNPFAQYSSDERTRFATAFMKSDRITETEEEGSWLYTSDSMTLRITRDGLAEYLAFIDPRNETPSLYESLQALKAFIVERPLHFSNYRIVHVEENANKNLPGFVFWLYPGNAPVYRYTHPFVKVEVCDHTVISFVCELSYAKPYAEIFRAPAPSTFADCNAKRDDIFWFYEEGIKAEAPGVLGFETLR